MDKQQRVRLQWEGKGSENSGAYSFQREEIIFPGPCYDGLKPMLPESLPGFDPDSCGRLIQGDALPVCHYLLDQGYGERFRMIYLDPPYFSSQRYSSHYPGRQGVVKLPAFDDRWQHGLDTYLEMMYQRLLLMRKLLMANGSILVHLDWHCSHYVRVLLDEIFGMDGFVNELVWCYAGGSNTQRHFQRKHDLIFWYAKAPDYYFQPLYRPYSAGTLQRGLTAVKGNSYRLKAEGALMQDWWTDIPKILSPTAYENLKYPTQKPRTLLERIISATSAPGDLIGDFFAGSSTTAEAADHLGRTWIVADVGALALQTSIYRLSRHGSAPFFLERAQDIIAEEIPGLGIDGDWCRDGRSLRIHLMLCFGLGEISPADIDFWEIDYNFDGMIFRSRLQILRSGGRFKGNLPLQADLLLLLDTVALDYQIAVKVRDFSGRSHSAVLTLNDRRGKQK